jgi:hypothetical protein
MSNWTGRLALCAATLLIFTFGVVRRAETCADPGDPFDDYSIHPDIPLTKFTQGNLGILQPTFARSYLVLAYRYLSGVPLNKDEQQAAKALWQRRGIDASHIYLQYFPGQGDDELSANPYMQDTQDASEAASDWANARAQVTGTGAPKIIPMQGLDNYNEYLNCANDAFATAAATLKQRAAKFGKDHPGVQAWIAAQDAVFANCGGKPEEPILPAAADASLPEIFRFDREYQIAAAYMYSNHYDEAVKGFQHIAEEPNSPWHDLAPYLVARTMVRCATLDGPASDNPAVANPHYVTSEMQEAADYIKKLLADSPKRPFADALQALLDRAEFQLHPEEQTTLLSGRLRKPAPEGRFYNWLFDYTWLLDRRPDSNGDYGGARPDEYKKLTPDRAKDDLTDWMLTYPLHDGLAAQHALEMWRAHPDSKPWLVAAMENVQPSDPQANELLDAARKIPQSSPAFSTVFYQRMRMEGARHNDKEVREDMDALLAAPPPDLPAVAREALLDMRLDAAASLEDAVRFIPRSSCAVSHSEEITDCAKTLTDRGARFLNGLPLDALNDLLTNKAFPIEVNDKFSRNVFMRAVILERHDIAQPLSFWIFSKSTYQIPVPQEQIRNLLADYQAAKTSEEKQFSAIFLLQHLYAFGYQMDTNEPWCASALVFPEGNAPVLSQPPRVASFGTAAVLTDAQQKQAASELSTLNQADSQANYYMKSVLEFAEKHPDDPRVPEALSRAVKNARMNCNNSRTGALSKKAFDLLHSRYPDTTWAKNTKYWYGASPY